MDPKAMQDIMAGMMSGGGGGPKGGALGGMDEYGMKNMMEMMGKVEKDPELKK